MRMGTQWRGHLAGVALALAALPAGADVRTHWSAELGAGYDDNVGNAAQDADARDSATLSAGLNLDYRRALSLDTALLLRGGLRGEGVERVDGLSHARALALARLSHRPQGGFYMPTFAGWISAAALEFDSALRDGFELRGGVFVQEPLTTAVSARLGIGVAERRSDGDAFDLSAWSASLDLDWAVGSGLTLYAGYQYHDGDVVSSGTLPPKSTHLPGGIGSASAADLDDALEGQFAYRLAAKTQLATVGFNLPLSQRLALDGQLRRVDSVAGETRYERWQGLLSLLLRL